MTPHSAMPKIAAVIVMLGLVSSDAVADAFTDALQQALYNSDGLHAQVEAIQSAREHRITARAGQEWTTRLNIVGSQLERETTRADGRLETTNEDRNSISLALSKLLYDGGQGAANFSLAELRLAAAIAGYISQEQSLLLTASEAYVDVAANRLRLEVSATNVERLELHVAASKLRVEIGESTPTQLALAQSRLARGEASLIGADSNFINAVARYENVFGQKPPPALALPELAMQLPFSVAEAGRLALENHPAQQTARINEQIALRSLDTLAAQTRPTLGLDLIASSTDTDSNPAAMQDGESEQMSAQLTFSTPLLPRRSVRAAGRAGVADHKAAVRRLAASSKSVRLAAEVAYRNYQTAASITTATTAERNAARLFRDGVQREVDFGVKPLLDLLDAEQDAMLAEISLITAQRDFVLAGLRLRAAMGQLTAAELGLEPLFVAIDDLVRHSVPNRTYPESASDSGDE